MFKDLDLAKSWALARTYGKEKKKKKKEMVGLKERNWDRKERHKTGKGRRKKEVKRERES